MPLRCSCDKLNLVENILRTTRKGLNKAQIFKEDEAVDLFNSLNSCVDLFQHIQDEAERLLPPNHRLLNKDNKK